MITIMDALRRVVRALRVSARTAERRFGISGAQLFVLERLAEASAPSVDDLAKRTLTHQSSVSLVLTRLEAHGFVVRRPSKEDARRVEIALTSAGRALARRAPEPAQERLIAGLRRLRPTQLRHLARGLAALARAPEIAGEAPGMFFEEQSSPRRGRLEARRRRRPDRRAVRASRSGAC
jgi:DNA-binding MarR family transcriptional regulator